MKKILVTLLFTCMSLIAQEFTIEKITGNAIVLRGTSEKWERIELGQKLNNDDLVLTELNSLVQMSKANERFLLKEDAAIGLNYIKNISTNDLILALALDEIRNVPKIKNSKLAKNTAVYGAEVTNKNNLELTDNYLGPKKLRGAKQLNDNGYVESSIIAAREVFRNYPETAANFENRLYFADLLKDMDLYQEALSEYSRIAKLDLNEEQLKILDERNEEVSIKLMDQK